MERKVLMSLIVMSCLGLFSWNTAQGAGPSETKISAISAPFGTGSYVLSAALEDISKKHHPSLRVTHSESPGLVFNIKKLEKEPELRKSMIITSTPGVCWLAQNGVEPFDKKYPTPVLIANYNLISVWLASLNPEIKNGEGLTGKRVGLGRVPQISWSIEPEWVIRHGWGNRDKMKIQYIGMKEAIDALLDGLVDAAVVGVYFDPIHWKVSPSPQTLELMASGRKVNHISWGEEAIRKTVAKGIPIVPVTIPAKAVQGMSQDLAGFSDNVAWCVAREFPEEIAYELTRMVITHCAKFAEYSDLGKLMSPKALPFGWSPERIHPGAMRAYREAGILK
ncbi:MAG: TAXI family TRAP transporter solute-binding subunit [Thermodesulfobacteriota bacterium]